MNTETLFNFIILGIIFALIIHLLFKMFTPKINENFITIEDRCSLKKNKNKDKNKDKNKLKINKDYLNKNYSNENSTISSNESYIFTNKNCEQDPPINKKLYNNNKEIMFQESECPVLNSDLQIDDYIRKSLLNDSGICEAKKVYTRKEIDEYRNNFFSFNSSINQTSHNEDMVDKINDLYLSGNSDISKNHQNMAIKDLFNSLTQY